MGTSPRFAFIVKLANRIRGIGLISWGFLVGCFYTGFIIGLGKIG